MRLIDADAVVTIQTYDDMYEEWRAETMTVAEAMDKFSDEGCPPSVDAEPVRHGEWIKTRKHLWKKDEDGEVDEWAWEHGFHNGVRCEICHKTPCAHCEPDYDEKQDCREHYICSECGRVVIDFEPYCHCGAKMDGGKQDAGQQLGMGRSAGE